MRTTESPERPISFKPHLVRAIIEGRKHQTRRLARFKKSTRQADGVTQYDAVCPYKEGQMLWVREQWCGPILQADMSERFFYRATDALPTTTRGPAKWRPSIHMPREVCRLLLRVTSVRAERLRSITEIDASDEGTDPVRYGGLGPGPVGTRILDSYRDGFAIAWDGINLRRAGARWDDNPMVWVIGFSIRGRDLPGAS